MGSGLDGVPEQVALESVSTFTVTCLPGVLGIEGERETGNALLDENGRVVSGRAGGRWAEQGYRFLTEHFLDRKNGAYFWTTDLSGKVLNDRKILYGESFVIYSLVEYYRASGDKEALRRATDLYHDIQKHAHDGKNNGWI